MPVPFLKERTVLALLLGAGLTLLFCLLRRDDVSGVPPEAFWAMKARWKHCADVVLAGDSRVYRGLAPSEMEKELDTLRILNYGFSGTGLSADYLDGVESVLDPSSAHRVIVLHICPNCLSAEATKDNGFRDIMRKSSRERAASYHLGPLLRFFRSSTASEALSIFGLANPRRYIQDFHPDGWVSSAKIPEAPREFIESFEALLAREGPQPNPPHLVDGLFATVGLWYQRGIRVYGLRIPTSAGMLDVEDALRDYDERTIIRRFRESGGIWLGFDQTGYHSYDGIHLRRDAAKRLSRQLAQRIAEDLRRGS